MTSNEAAPNSSPAASSALLTFLLADIRGYTHFAGRHGDQAATDLSEHFLAICREVIGVHGGEVFGSAGDQALAVFSSVQAALHAALALQARLADERKTHPELPLLAGIGMDTGEAVRIGNDYRGNAVNLAARLCSLAGTGEILASDTVLTVAHAAKDIVQVDRGEVALKGFDHRVRVYQLFPEGVQPGALPPLQPTVAAYPTNLPDEPTPFIGREGEVGEIADLLAEPGVRLVTLTGPGGTGKTRLAIQVGARLLATFEHGVYFVDLAPVSAASDVPATIAGVLGVREEGGAELMQTITSGLRGKHLLLMLDNFEHLTAAATVVASLLDTCRNLHVLVTSRVRLHLSREREHTVWPLVTPDPTHLPDLPVLARVESVALFLDRAKAVSHSFALTDDNARAIATICARLDGLPLAIELAAARIKLLPPQTLLQRLDHQLQLLTGGPRDRPTRQQTLRNTIDWSYSLLSSEESALFARLSAFVGGCSLEAAEAVCNPQRSLDLIENLTSLVDKSLLRQEGNEEPRFTMLETIKEYADERLGERGERASILAAHATYFTQLAQAAEREVHGPEQAARLHQLEREHDNLRAALARSLETKDGSALPLAVTLWKFWYIQGHYTEGRRWLNAVLAQGGVRAGDQALRARALNGAGVLAMMQGEAMRAQELCEEALDLWRKVGDKMGIVQGLNSLAGIALEQRQFERTTALLEQTLQLWRELGDKEGLAQALNNLGTVAVNQGDYQRAKKPLEEALGLWRELGDKTGIALALDNLATVTARQGDTLRAAQLRQESLRLWREVGDRGGMASALLGLAAVAALRHEYEAAARLVGAVDAFWTSIAAVPNLLNREAMESTTGAAREALGEAAYEAARQEGQTMRLEQAVAYALGEDR